MGDAHKGSPLSCVLIWCDGMRGLDGLMLGGMRRTTRSIAGGCEVCGEEVVGCGRCCKEMVCAV